MYLSEKIILLVLFFINYCHGNKNKTDHEAAKSRKLLDILEKFEKGEYSFRPGQSLTVYNSVESTEKNYSIHILDGYDSCVGLTTDAFETIVLQCPETKPEKLGCFEVYTPKNKPQNNTVIPIREVFGACVEQVDANCVGVKFNFSVIILECLASKMPPPATTTTAQEPIQMICAGVVGGFCIGVATPLKSMILLECLPSSTLVPQFGIDVPRNGPPPRM